MFVVIIIHIASSLKTDHQLLKTCQSNFVEASSLFSVAICAVGPVGVDRAIVGLFEVEATGGGMVDPIST